MALLKLPRIVVIGAGISGSSTANLLIRSSYNPQVTLIAEKLSPNTTSDVAGASMWLAVEGTQEKCLINSMQCFVEHFSVLLNT